MNFLQNKTDLLKKVIFALVISSCFALVVAGQNPPASQQGKMYGDPGFVGEPINLNVVNADIRDILNYVTEQYGVNFVIDKSVGAIPVTVNVSEVPWNLALDSILQAQELAVQVNGPILRIASQKTIAAEQEIKNKIRESQLDTSPLYTEFIRLNYARAAGTLTGEAGGSGAFSGGVVGGGGGGGSSSSSSSSNSADQGVLGIIKRRLSRRGAVEVDGRSNTLIITDVRENIDAIRQLVVLLDQPEPQVEIETRIVIANRNFARDLGVSLGIDIANPFGRGGVISGQTNNRIPSSTGGVISLTTGAFGTAQIRATLDLNESKGQVKTIATPRVTALNNRPAQIESGSQIPITTVQRDQGEDAIPVVTTTFVNVPLRLSVTPQISDAGVVILRVVAENNTLNDFSSALTGTPGIDTQRMQTEVLVPDGGTTVVGGVVVDREAENRNSTPGFASIPLLKYLFKNKSVDRSTGEILFFITPRIYRTDYNGNVVSGKVSDGNRSTTLIQPVPLGNPASNSTVPGQTTPQNPLIPTTIPVNPATNPVPTSNNETRP